MKRKTVSTPKKSKEPTNQSPKSPPTKKSKDVKDTKEQSTDLSVFKKKPLSKKQAETIKNYNQKALEQDKESLAMMFAFLANQLETKISLKLGISSIYLIIEELYNCSKEGIVGIQGEKNLDKLIRSVKQFDNFENSIIEAKIRLELVLFKVHNCFHDQIGEDDQEIEEGDECHIFKRIKHGFGLIGKGISIKKNETTVFLKDIESILEFEKLDSKPTEFSLRLVRKASSKKEKEVQRRTFIASRKTTVISTEDEESEIELESESESEPEPEHDLTSKVQSKFVPEVNNSSELSELLQIPDIISIFKKTSLENEDLRSKIAQYQRAIKAFNQAIKLMVDCVDNYPDVFNVKETSITIGKEVITISHLHHSQLNKLNESKKIKYIATHILKKPLSELNEEEIELVLKIIIDIRGLDFNVDKEEVSKLRNIFRNVKCTSKKQ